MPLNRLRACNVHLNLTAAKKEEDFRSLSKTSQVYKSILKTTQFLNHWLTEIQSYSVLYGRVSEEFPSTCG